MDSEGVIKSESLFFFLSRTKTWSKYPPLLQTVDFVRLLHRRTAPPDEGEACLSNWQIDSRRFMIGQYWDTISSQLLRESDFKVGERGGSFRLVSRGEACDAKLSGELKVESVCNELPPELDQHPILWFFWTVTS